MPKSGNEKYPEMIANTGVSFNRDTHNLNLIGTDNRVDNYCPFYFA